MFDRLLTGKEKKPKVVRVEKDLTSNLTMRQEQQVNRQSFTISNNDDEEE